MDRAAIELAPPEAVADETLGRLIARGAAAGVPDGRLVRLLAHVPGYAEALFDALERSHMDGTVDHRLKEIIRIQLARLANDPYFSAMRSRRALEDGLTEETIEAGCGDFEADPRFSPAEKWALRYAWLMFREPKRVDKAFYDQGKTHYSEAEIMELGAFIAFHYGMQIFLGTIALPPERAG